MSTDNTAQGKRDTIAANAAKACEEPVALDPDAVAPGSTYHNAKGKWGKGNPGGGRPKGSVSGRLKTVRLLDAILEQPEVQDKIATAMVNSLMKGDKSALDFLSRFVMPLVPKEATQEPDEKKDKKLPLGINVHLAIEQPKETT